MRPRNACETAGVAATRVYSAVMPVMRPLFLAAGLATLVGCTSGDYCSQALDKQMECASPEQRVLYEGRYDNDRKECRERKDRDQEEEKAELACVQKASCEDYTVCIKAISDARYGNKIRKQVSMAVESGEKLEDALQACRFSGVRDADLDKACGALYAKALEASTRDLEAMREQGAGSDNKCPAIEEMAEKVSPEAKAKIKGLCDEVEASRTANAAIAEARKHLEARTLEVPYQCGIAVDNLERIGNDWARGKLADVAKSCYVELGNAILPSAVPAMQLSCDYQVDQVYKMVKKYNLKDAGLDPWIDKASAKCSNATASAG